MRRRIRPTVAAALLTALAIALPSAAWWAGGTRAAERERVALMDAVQVGARRQAFRLAERLRGRLEGVVRAESRRPFFEYSFRYQDPQQACDCATWVESPLSRGPVEPLIWAHFEIDRQGRLSVPSDPPTNPDAQPPADGGAQPPRGAADHEESARLLRGSVGALARAAWRANRSVEDADPEGAGGPRVDAVGASAASVPRPSPPRDATLREYGDEVVLVEPFRWHTVEMKSTPYLVALRSVRPTDGSRIQGFVISRDAVQAALPSEPYVMEFRPRGAELHGVAEGVGLDGADWEVAIDAGEVLDAAILRGDEAEADFRRRFFGGSAGALLVGACLVGLVAQSERTAKQRSRFAASAAHELRTPLAGIRLYGEMLADELGDPARQRDYARQVANEADRLSRVVSNVLGYSNLERGKLSVQREPGDLEAVVADLTEKLRMSVEANGGTLTFVAPSARLPVLAFDADAVEQILGNLVDNAERYSRDSPDREIRVELQATDDGAELTVTDAGPGVPSAERRSLFRPFARGRDPDAPGGLGLGLTLVSSLMKAHRGTIRYEARQPVGSVFRLRFPR